VTARRSQEKEVERNSSIAEEAIAPAIGKEKEERERGEEGKNI
jgi:hypothetical protein